jgi:hypothetical protein
VAVENVAQDDAELVDIDRGDMGASGSRLSWVNVAISTGKEVLERSAFEEYGLKPPLPSSRSSTASDLILTTSPSCNGRNSLLSSANSQLHGASSEDVWESSIALMVLSKKAVELGSRPGLAVSDSAKSFFSDNISNVKTPSVSSCF